MNRLKLIFLVAAFICGWLLLGPIVIFAALPIFLRKPYDMDNGLWVPTIPTFVAVGIAAGLLALLFLEFVIPTEPLKIYMATIAEVRIFKSSIITAVSEGRWTATREFFFEQVAACLSIIGGAFAMRNRSRFARFLDVFIEQLENSPEGKPRRLFVLFIFMCPLFIFGLYNHPSETAFRRGLGFLTPAVPALTFSIAAYVIKYWSRPRN